MNIYRYILTIGTIFLLNQSYAQTITKFENVDDFTVDQLGYIYIVSKTGQLKKVTQQGDSVAVFNQVKKHGLLSHIDVSNPLKVLLFYKNFNTVVMLDRLLNVTATLDLRKIEKYQITAVGTSYDNNIWIYDEMNAELIRIDESGNKIANSYSLVDIITDLPRPIKIIDQQRIVYLYDKDKGLYQFDNFGGYKGKLKIVNWNNIFVWNDILYGRSGNQIMKYNLKTHEEHSIQLDEKWRDAKKIYFLPQTTYVLLNDQLQIINLKE